MCLGRSKVFIYLFFYFLSSWTNRAQGTSAGWSSVARNAQSASGSTGRQSSGGWGQPAITNDTYVKIYIARMQFSMMTDDYALDRWGQSTTSATAGWSSSNTNQGNSGWQQSATSHSDTWGSAISSTDNWGSSVEKQQSSNGWGSTNDNTNATSSGWDSTSDTNNAASSGCGSTQSRYVFLL